MKPDDLFDGIGLIDDRLIEEALLIHRGANRWLKYGSLAACFLCICAAGVFFLKQQSSIGQGSFHPELPSEVGLQNPTPAIPAESAPRATEDHISMDANMDIYDTVLVQETLYFSDASQGLFKFDTQSGTLSQISEHSGSLLYAADGLLCWDVETGTTYLERAGTLELIGEIPAHSQVIGMANGIAYWYPTVESSYETGIYQTTMDSGSTDLLTALSDVVQTGQLIGSTIYYQTGTGAIYAFVLDQANTMLVSNEFEEQTHMAEATDVEQYFASGTCTFFDEFAVIPVETYRKNAEGGFVSDSRACYRLSYENGYTELMTSDQLGSNISLYNRKLYYIKEPNGEGARALVSYDLDSGNAETISGSDSDKIANATEIFVCAQGCYYVDPASSDGGIYFFDLTSGTSERVFPGNTTNVSVDG